MMCGDGMAQRPRHRRKRRLMQHEIGAATRTRAHRGVRDGAFNKIDSLQEAIEVLALARREIVDDYDLLAFPNEMFHEMRANEARAAGHEIAHVNSRSMVGIAFRQRVA